ncbi:hypothetical protein ACTMS0_09330 [Micromonospora sp. H33]|uniref:hypothetical protein n=1 Tax=Micromonospora sp. H33 TaxID=3452215 RepID=UPI003F8A2367
MSKRFLTKLAGGVALGTAALLLGTPVAALASDGHDSKHRSSDRDGFVCGTAEQINKVLVAQIVSDNEIEDSDVRVDQRSDVTATNDNRTQPNNVIVCIRDVDLELELELED